MEETYDTYEKILISKAFQKGIPLNASLELLPLCNMNCQMCYVRLDSEEMKQKDRLRTAEEWFDLARQMKEAGILFVMLTGGEPLLYPDFKKVYLGLRSLGMIVTVNTNGTLLDEHWADFFAANPPEESMLRCMEQTKKYTRRYVGLRAVMSVQCMRCTFLQNEKFP